MGQPFGWTQNSPQICGMLWTAQRYYIAPTFARGLAKKPEQPFRNALRMWMWLKTHGIQSAFYIKELRQTLKQNGFAYSQQKKYLQILQEHGYIGRDLHGKIYLRGQQVMFAGMNRSKKRIVIEVTPDHVKDQESWMNFLAGCQVVSTQVNIKKHTAKTLVRHASTSQKAGGNSEAEELKGAPVSIENLTNTLQVSPATASRIRARGAAGGLITNNACYHNVSDLFPWVRSRQDVMALRGQLKESLPPVWLQRKMFHDSLIAGRIKEVINPDAITFSHGCVYMRRPNMVENVGIIFFKIKR